jgi:hypothetical protein
MMVTQTVRAVTRVAHSLRVYPDNADSIPLFMADT